MVGDSALPRIRVALVDDFTFDRLTASGTGALRVQSLLELTPKVPGLPPQIKAEYQQSSQHDNKDDERNRHRPDQHDRPRRHGQDAREEARREAAPAA